MRAISASARSSPRAGSGLVLGSFLAARRARQGRSAAPLRRLDRAHGRRLGRRGAQRLDLARGAVRHRGRGGERRGDHLQPAPRPARRARPYRGRALATIMSSNYAVLGLGMAAAGVSSARSARARSGWPPACSTSSAAVVALVDDALAARRARRTSGRRSRRARSPRSRRWLERHEPELEPEEVANGVARRLRPRADRDAARGDRGAPRARSAAPAPADDRRLALAA